MYEVETYIPFDGWQSRWENKDQSTKLFSTKSEAQAVIDKIANDYELDLSGFRIVELDNIKKGV